MPAMTEAEFKKQLESRQFSNLYFLYGEETYLVKKYAEKLFGRADPGLFPDFNAQSFDGEQISVDDLAAAVEALPFMAERKCVKISNFNADACGAADLSKLEELLQEIPETTILLFFYPSVPPSVKKTAKWKKIFALFLKLGTVLEIKKRDGATIEKLLCTAAAKRQCELSRRDAARMVSSCGNDLQTLFLELDKVCAYVGNGEITSKDIDLLVTKNLETTVFLLSKAILSGEYDKAYSVLNLLFDQNEDPVGILAVLASSYLDFYRARACIQSGLSALEAAKYFDYKRKEFRLRNAERDGARFSTAILRKSLEVLLDADVALKTARGDRRLILEKLIARLLLITEKEKLA